jgi:hypothetical protein
MSTTFEARPIEPAERQRQLAPDECRAWLVSHHEGRLGYITGRGHRRLAVRYVTSGDQIVFQLPDYNDAVHYAPDAQVSLVVDGRSGTGGFKTVIVFGTASLSGEDAISEVDAVHLDEPWPPGVVSRVIRLPMTRVIGYVTGSPAADDSAVRS